MRNRKFDSILVSLLVICFSLFIAEDSSAQQKDTKIESTLLEHFTHLTMATTNFAIHYNRFSIPADYAGRVAEELEYSWGYLVEICGFRTLNYTTQHRIPVYIKPAATFPRGALGYFTLTPKGIPEIYIPDNLAWDIRKSTLAHEFFHSIQYAYNMQQESWLKEATAVWAEDEVFKDNTRNIGYVYYSNSWYDFWKYGFDLRGNFMKYGSSIFFKYLTEHSSNGSELIKLIWENAAKWGATPAVKEAITQGYNPPEADKVFLRDFASFSTAAYLKDRPPYDFKRANDIGGDVRFEKHSDWYGAVYKMNFSYPVIHPIKYKLNPMSALYLRFNRPSKLKHPANLYISVAAGKYASISFVLINGGKPGQPEFLSDKGIFFKKIPNFYNDDVDLVVSCAEANPTWINEISLRYAVSEPPYVKEVNVFEGDGSKRKLMYRGAWRDTDKGMAFEVPGEGIELTGKEKVLKDISLKVVFSEKIYHKPTVKVGKKEVSFKQIWEEEKWESKPFDLPITKKDLANGFIPIEISAEDLSGTPLDAHPLTKPTLSEDGSTWLGFESEEGGSDTHRGGTDKMHKISFRAKPPYVERVSVKVDGKDIYNAGWSTIEAQEMRLLEKSADEEFDIAKALSGLITVYFSKPISASEVKIGPLNIQLTKEEDGVFRTRVNLSRLKSFFKDADNLPIIIAATDINKNRLDSEPHTIAVFDKMKNVWVDYEAGNDECHKLKIKTTMPKLAPFIVKGVVVDESGNGVAGATVVGYVAYVSYNGNLSATANGEEFIRINDEINNLDREWQKRQQSRSDMVRQSKFRKSLGESYHLEEQQKDIEIYNKKVPLYKKFDSLGDELLKEAIVSSIYCKGSDPSWMTRTDTNGNFEIKEMLDPFRQDIIVARHDVLVFKDGYEVGYDSLGTDPQSADFVERHFFGYKARSSYRWNPCRDEYQDFRVELYKSEKENLRYTVGGIASGDTVMFPDEKGPSIEVFIFEMSVVEAVTPSYVSIRPEKTDESGNKVIGFRVVGFRFERAFDSFMPIYKIYGEGEILVGEGSVAWVEAMPHSLGLAWELDEEEQRRGYQRR